MEEEVNRQPRVERPTPSHITPTASTRPTTFKQRWTESYTPAKPDPWLQRKLAVGVIFALIVWAFYVVIGRVCAPAIQQDPSSPFSKGAGAGILVGFVLLWMMFAWSYVQIITVGPGFAKQLVTRTPPPPTSPDLIPYRAPEGAAMTPAPVTSNDDPAGPDPSEFAPVRHLAENALGRTSSNQRASSITLAGQTTTKAPAVEKGSKLRDWREIERPVPRVEYGPRWCRFCEINKPDRTHHCRHCGTCVLQFDHHCLWLGQCVGWGNHKYFITFNLWAMIFCLYVLVVLSVFLAQATILDGQMIGLVAVAGLFFMFTAMMLPTHVYLILRGKTTVESYKSRDQHDEEANVLNKEYGYLLHNMEKRKVQTRWREEYGGVSVDARWRFGTAREMWIQEMGRSWVGWILPIGRPLGNGMQFQANPRFGPHGEWLKRVDWPKELQ